MRLPKCTTACRPTLLKRRPPLPRHPLSLRLGVLSRRTTRPFSHPSCLRAASECAIGSPRPGWPGK
eukprot:364405-Chlamydomonas_euryale.AAC.5